VACSMSGRAEPASRASAAAAKSGFLDINDLLSLEPRAAPEGRVDL
jgi:hypothetical protein